MASDRKTKKKTKGSFGRLQLPVAPSYLRPASRRWTIVVAALGLTAAAVALAFASLVTHRSALSPGKVSSAHASFETSCTTCHESPAWRVSRATLDAKCVDCHESRRNPGAFSLATHAEYRSGDVDRRALGVDEPSCAACHQEHQGRAHDVLDNNGHSCAGCHAFGAFEDGHPEFTRVEDADVAGLRFAHAPHVREVVRRKGLAREELARACLHCHETVPSGRTFAPIDFDRHCGACHLNGGTPTHWLRVAAQGANDVPGVQTLETLRGSSDSASLAYTSASDFQSRDRGRVVRKRSVGHRDPWITANLRRIRQAMFPAQGLADLLAASGDVPVHESRSVYDEALARLREQARELRGAPVREVQRDLDAIEKHIEELERRVLAPETALDLAPFTIDAGDRNPQMTPERFARFEAFVDTLTATCATCHLIENATIVRVQTDQRALDRAHFDHGAHQLQRSCADCHDRIDLAPAAVFSDAPLDPATDHAGIQNLPAKESCATCHRTGRVASACISCHDYHPDKIQRTQLVLGRQLMGARLFAKTGPFRDCEHWFDGEVSIGRSSSNDLTLDSSYVSGRHARIYFDPEASCYVIEDRNSRNGVLVDGVRVRRTHKLGHLHVVSFSRAIDFIFQVLEDAASPSTMATDVTQIGDADLAIPSIAAEPEDPGPKP